MQSQLCLHYIYVIYVHTPDMTKYSLITVLSRLYHFFAIVSVPPSIKGGNITTEVTALLDTMVTLECEARGVPLPTITWYRNREAILSNRQAQYVERGHYLKIPRAQASDAGQYSCKVTSVAGSAEKSYELDVYCKNLIIYRHFSHCALCQPFETKPIRNSSEQCDL